MMASSTPATQPETTGISPVHFQSMASNKGPSTNAPATEDPNQYTATSPPVSAALRQYTSATAVTIRRMTPINHPENKGWSTPGPYQLQSMRRNNNPMPKARESADPSQ